MIKLLYLETFSITVCFSSVRAASDDKAGMKWLIIQDSPTLRGYPGLPGKGLLVTTYTKREGVVCFVRVKPYKSHGKNTDI